MKKYDFLIVGGGIVGLTVARALARRGAGSVLVLEKEPELGRHASGRNSGVVHTGIYYGTDSFKAKVCGKGAALLRAYAEANGIPLRKTGKVIVATRPDLEAMIPILAARAKANGAVVEILSVEQLSKIEPRARTFGFALFSPETAVIDSHQVLACLEIELKQLGVELLKSTPVVAVHSEERIVRTPQLEFGYNRLINAAGLHADQIAHWMGVGRKYRILPFKGIYAKLRPEISKQFYHAIYPVPDLGMPFLGVHLTLSVQGEVLVGPTAIPALGRENYGLWDGLTWKEMPLILGNLAGMWIKNVSNFRQLVKEETARYLPGGLAKSARELVPSLRREDFLPGIYKVGLRAQLVEIATLRLVMDFVVEDGPSSLHILNAVSPAFTASFYFAELIADQILQPGRSAA